MAFEGSNCRQPNEGNRAYQCLLAHIETFAEFTILPFDQAAVAHVEEMIRARIRIGTMDRRIAAIALANDATLLTRNLADFARIPNLRAEDWSA